MKRRRHINGSLAVLAALPFLFSACGRPEPPLPPREALKQASDAITTVLAEERQYANSDSAPHAAGPGDPESLSFWHFSHPVIAPAAASLERRRRPLGNEVALDAQFIGEWPQAVQKLSVAAATNDLPDVVLVKRPWLARLIGAGRVVPLDDLLPPALVNDLVPAVRESLTYEGRLYAWPADGFCSVLYCNAARIKTPPRTWPEMRQTAAAVTNPDDDPPVYGLGYVPFLEALWSAGGRVCDESQCHLTDAPAMEALEFVLSLRDEGYVAPGTLAQPDRAFHLFLAGWTSMTVADSSLVSQTQALPFPVDMAPVPGKDGPVSLLSDNAIAVLVRPTGPKREALAQLLDHMTGVDAYPPEAVKRGAVPPRESALHALDTPPGIVEALRHGRNTPLIPAWSRVEFEMYQSLDRAYRWGSGAGPR